MPIVYDDQTGEYRDDSVKQQPQESVLRRYQKKLGYDQYTPLDTVAKDVFSIRNHPESGFSDYNDWINKMGWRDEVEQDRNVVSKAVHDRDLAQRYQDEFANRGALRTAGSIVAGGIYDAAQMTVNAARAAREALGGTKVSDETSDTLFRPTSDALAKYKNESPFLNASPDEGFIAQGARSAVQSLTTAIPGAAAGFLAGGPAGAVIGGISSRVMGAPAFGLAEYANAIDTGLASEKYKRGDITKDQIESAALKSGIAEGGFEFLGDLLGGEALLGGLALKPAKKALTSSIKDLFKEGFKEAAKNTAKRVGLDAAFETGSELATSYVQAGQYNILSDKSQTAIEAMRDTLGPALVASLIFGGISEVSSKVANRLDLMALKNPDIPSNRRLIAANRVKDAISEISPDFGNIWIENATEAIKSGHAIDPNTQIQDIKAPSKRVAEMLQMVNQRTAPTRQGPFTPPEPSQLDQYTRQPSQATQQTGTDWFNDPVELRKEYEQQQLQESLPGGTNESIQKRQNIPIQQEQNIPGRSDGIDGVLPTGETTEAQGRVAPTRTVQSGQDASLVGRDVSNGVEQEQPLWKQDRIKRALKNPDFGNDIVEYLGQDHPEGYPNRYYSPNRPVDFVRKEGMKPNGKFLYTNRELTPNEVADLELIPVSGNLRAKLAINSFNETNSGKPIEFYKQDGDNIKGAVITKSAKKPGEWQVTYYDLDGFQGDAQRNSQEEAVNEALDSGFSEFKPGMLNRVASTERFQNGNKKVAEIQKKHKEFMNKVHDDLNEQEKQSNTNQLNLSNDNNALKQNIENKGASDQVKQPWEMTKEEFISKNSLLPAIRNLDTGEIYIGKRGDIHSDIYDKIHGGEKKRVESGWSKDGKWVSYKDAKDIQGQSDAKDTWKKLNDEHSASIAIALSEGKPVPKEVLAEYPDLVNKQQNSAPADMVEPANQTAPTTLPEDQRTIENTTGMASGGNGPLQNVPQKQQIQQKGQDNGQKEKRLLSKEGAGSLQSRPEQFTKGQKVSYRDKTGTVRDIRPNGRIRIDGDDGKVSVVPAGEVSLKQKTVQPTKSEQSITPKQQKTYLINEIDKAFETANSGGLVTGNQSDYLETKKKHGTVTIDIPGDGQFTIPNTKEYLSRFKKAASSYPTVQAVHKNVSIPSLSSSNKRMQGTDGVSYYNSFKPRTVREVIAPEDTNKANGNYGWNEKNKVYSSGPYMIVLDRKPKAAEGGNLFEGREEQVSNLLNTPENFNKEVSISGEYAHSGENGMPKVHVKLDGSDLTFDAKYVDNILTIHPDAKTFMNDNKSELAFIDKGKVVGIVMRYGAESFDSEFIKEGYNRLYGDNKTQKPFVSNKKNKRSIRPEDWAVGDGVIIHNGQIGEATDYGYISDINDKTGIATVTHEDGTTTNTHVGNLFLNQKYRKVDGNGVGSKRVKYAKNKFKEIDIESENFKNWFSGSKVLDADGKPKKLYSGHANSEMWGEKWDKTKGTAGGFYATDDPAIASNYSMGKFGVKENFQNGDQYRLAGKDGKLSKKIWQYQLSNEQLDKLEELKNQIDENGDHVNTISEMDRYINDNKNYDKTVRSWSYRGGSKNLFNIYQFYDMMGNTIAYPEMGDKPYYERQRKSDFENLLDDLGIKWNSYEWSQPGVFQVYLNIKNPIDTSKPFPKDLLADLEKMGKRERIVSDQESMRSQWTKEYPVREWVNDIKRSYGENGDTFWATQIPKKAIPIIKKYGYDGIKDTGGKMGGQKHEVWVAIEPTQIKSAISNTGEFSSNDARIRYSQDLIDNGESELMDKDGNKYTAHFYSDKLSHSTFAVKPGETVEEKLFAQREKNKNNAIMREARKKLEQMFGKKKVDAMFERGDWNIIDLNGEVFDYLNKKKSVVPYSIDKDAVAFYDPNDGKTYFVGEKINPDLMVGRALHEEFHQALDRGIFSEGGLLGTDKGKAIQSHIEALNRSNADTPLVRSVKESFRQAEAAGTAKEDLTEEATAYLIQKSDFQNSGIFKRIAAQTKSWLYRNGLLNAQRLNDKDIAAMMAWSVKMRGKTGVGSSIGTKFAKVWHGTPHIWQPEPGFPHGRPRLDKIGSGEGNTTYGWGWYSADSDVVADSYRRTNGGWHTSNNMVNFGIIPEVIRANLEAAWANRGMKAMQKMAQDYFEKNRGKDFSDDLHAIAFSDKPETGTIYKLDIPDDVMPKLLDWDKPLSEQSEYVKEAIFDSDKIVKTHEFNQMVQKIADEYMVDSRSIFPVEFKSLDEKRKWIIDNWAKEDAMDYLKSTEFIDNNGSHIYEMLTRRLGSDKAASEYLASIGIPGNKYLDQMSRPGSISQNKETGKWFVNGKGVSMPFDTREAAQKELDRLQTRNYVIWDQPTLDKIALLERNGEKLDALRDSQIKLSKQQFEPVDTNSENFKKWFGDSKIVFNNRPLVVYHSTPYSFDAFDTTINGGSHFGTKIAADEANKMSKKISYDIEEEDNKFYVIPDNGDMEGETIGEFNTKKEAIAFIRDQPKRTPLIAVYLSIRNPMIVEDMGHGKGWEKAREIAIEKGYDGLKYINEVEDKGKWSYVAFYPTQIKSAISNTGEFSPTNPDIRYSKSYQEKPDPETIFRTAKNKVIDFAESHGLKDRLQNFLIYLTDENLPVDEIQKKLAPKRGGAGYKEDADYALYRRLTNRKSAEEVRVFKENTLIPHYKHLADNGLTFSDEQELGWAQHAPERNLQMKRVNARRFIDRILSNLSEGEREPFDRELKYIGEEEDSGNISLHQKRDAYVDLMDRLSIHAQNELSDMRDKAQKAQDKINQDNTGSNKVSKLKERIDEIDKTWKYWEDVKDRLSGMTNDQADKIVKKWKDDKRWDAISKATEDLRQIAKDALSINHHAGELTTQEYNTIKNAYENYLPLYREDRDLEKQPVGKQSVGPLAKPVHYAAGSTKAVENIIGHVVDQYYSAIRRKNSLESGKVLYNFVKEYGSNDTIALSKPNMVFRQDSEGNIREYPDHVIDKNQTYVKVDGKTYMITANKDDPSFQRFMDMINRKPPEIGPLIKASQKVTRTLAALSTSWSPEFLLTNAPRDFQTALVNLEDTEARGMQKKVFGGLKDAIKAIYKTEIGGTPTNKEWGNTYDRFRSAGGKLGWMVGYENTNDLLKQLESDFDYAAGKKPLRQKFQEMTKYFDAANTSVENAVRLSLFKVLTDPNGLKLSDKRAVYVANNITVDFTRKGTAGPAMNALYMFANAGIQGNVRLIKALVRSKSAQKIAGGIFAAGAMAGFIGPLIGGDDDDGESYYEKLKRVNPDMFNRYIVMMIPGSKGKYVKIPMAYGYSPLFVAGNELASVLRGGKASRSAMNIVNALSSSFNPLESATLLQTIMPTVLDPIAYIAENKTWYGGELMPNDNPFGLPKPKSQRYFKDVNPIAREATKWVNRLTGGSEIKPGAIDVSPEVVEMLFENYTGAVGSMIKDTLSMPVSALSGDMSIRKVPGVRRLFGEKTNTVDRILYQENMNEVQYLKKEYKDGTQDERDVAITDPRFKIVRFSDAIDREISKIKKRIRIADKNGLNTDVLREKLEKLYVTFNKKYNSTLSIK